MASAAGSYALESRALNESDEDWIQRFAAGEEWWSHEVTDFLRNDALEQGKQGLNVTNLFSFPGFREIVGFCTTAVGSVSAAVLDEVLSLPPGVPARVPAVLIAYMAVARPYRRVGHFGQEMHLQLLEGVAASSSWAVARVIYLECWEENEAGIAFWQRMGYVQFHRLPAPRPDNGVPTALARMVYDRFAIRP